MTATVESLLKRCLHDVFGERDPVRRRRVIAEIWAEDAMFMDHSGTARGHDEINATVTALQARLPEHVFAEFGRADVLNDGGRLAWTYARPDQPEPIRGVDIIVVKQGRISTMLTFLDKVPSVP